MPSSIELLKYFNLAIIAFIAFFAIIGFFRGTRKSIFYLISTMLIFGLGWILMTPASKMIMNFDVSSFGLSVQDLEVNNLNQLINDLVKENLPEVSVLMREDTLAKELVYALSTMVIKLVYIIVLIVLAFSVFKLFTDIFWLIFKPKKKKGFAKKRKTFGNRMIGFGIGGFKGLFYTLLICLPIAGIASIASSLSTVTKDPSEDLSYNLVFVNNQVSLVETSQSNDSNQFNEILDILGIYKKSVAGKIFGTTKVDTFLFDGIFSFEINNTSVKLRKELEIVANALSKSESFSNGNFDINSLLEEDPEVLKSIVNELSKLELVKVALPMGIEVVLYLEDQDGNKVVDIPEEVKSKLNLDEIKKINFSGDFKKLGYAFVDITTIYSFDGSNQDINYLGFDPEVVKSIMNNIGGTASIDHFAPIAISYVTSLKQIQDMLAKLGLTVDDLNLDEVLSWGDEISQLGIIYEKVYDLQIKKFDSTETFEYVTEEKVTALSNAIFESTMLSNAIPVIVRSVSDGYIPDGYKENLVFDDGIWDANEFSNLLNATVAIYKSGIINDDADAFKNISDETINDLAKYLSKSKFITTNLNVIIDYVMDSIDYFEENTELEVLKVEEWTETELSSLFKATRLLVSVDSSEILSLEEAKVKELSNYLANSKFITRNIDNIIDTVFKNIDLGEDITLGKFDEWEDSQKAEKEFYYLMTSAKILNSKGSNLDALLQLSDEDLDSFLNSHIISETMVNVLKVYSAPGKRLELLEGVEDPDVNWHDELIEDASFTINDQIITILEVEGATNYFIYKNDVKIGSTRNLQFTLTEFDPTANYKVKAINAGELRRMFVAIGALTDSIAEDKPFTTDTITNLTDEEIDNILVSEILVRSLIKKLEDMSLEADSFVVIPQGPLTSEDDEVKLNAWKDRKENGILIKGELSKTFVGLRLFLKDVDIDNFDISSITNLSDEDIYEILKSDVLSESLIVQIEKLSDDEGSVFQIPSNVGLDDKNNRDAWKNIYVYNEQGILVPASDGELTNLLRAIRVIGTNGDIENIDVVNILEEENRETVLASLIIEETIINKIITVSDENDIIIPSKYRQQDRSPWKKSDENGDGELRNLLNALSYIMDDDDSINNFTFDIGTVIEEQDEILKSDIIVETVINKLEEQDEIYIPTSIEYGLTNEEDRSPWKNLYELDGSNNYVYVDGKVKVLKHGELSRLLNAADLIVEKDPVTNERTFDNITFDINIAFDDAKQLVLLKSLVISETIVQKIFDEAKNPNTQIKLPSEAYVNQMYDDARDLWFNAYDNELLVSKGEIAYLLEAIEIILGPDGNFTNFEFDLNKFFEDEKQLIVLKSKVISESIVNKIYEEANNASSMVKIPNRGYVEDLNDPNPVNRTKWFNKYDNDNVISFGELSYLLEAIEVLVGPDGSFNNLNFDLSKVFDDEKQEIVLKSKVISETIVIKVFEESTTGLSDIKVPSDLYLEQKDDPRDLNRDRWFNNYNGNILIEKGEIAYLLDAVELLVGPDGNFSNLSFNLNALFDDENQDKILRSKVVSETIVHKIYLEKDNGFLYIPSATYVNPLGDENRDKWFNDYDAATIIKGEISNLIEAVERIVGSNGTFENLTFDLSATFDDDNQIIILKSKVVSETMVHKIFDEASNNVLTIPHQNYVNQLNDTSEYNRDKWFNIYEEELVTKKELANLLEAAELILNGASFTNIDFDLNILFDENKQKEVLKSFVFSETIINKIISNENAVPNDTLPTIDLMGRSLDDSGQRDAWYNRYTNGILVEKNELAKFLDSIALLLGTNNTFETMGKITIDDILNLEFNVVMNEDKVVVSSDFDILLDSIVMEYIIAPLVNEIATESSLLGDYLSTPVDGYHFKKEELITNFDLSTFNSELYDTKSFLDSLYLLNNAGFHYSEIGNMELETLNEETVDGLGDAMVASRAFRGSIAQMYNTIGRPYYDNLPENPPILVKKDWDLDIKFIQSDYDSPKTALEAHSLFKDKLLSWTNIYTFYN